MTTNYSINVEDLLKYSKHNIKWLIKNHYVKSDNYYTYTLTYMGRQYLNALLKYDIAKQEKESFE